MGGRVEPYPEPKQHSSVDPHDSNSEGGWGQVNSPFQLPGLGLKSEGSSVSERADWCGLVVRTPRPFPDAEGWRCR